MFRIKFYKLRTYSGSANSTDFLFLKCLFITSHTLHLTLFTSTLFRIFFEFLFLNLYLGALFYKKIKEKKICENLALGDRCIIKKMISEKM